MTVAPTRRLIADAAASGTAIAAFNVLHLETAEALALAAERAELPLILQISENCVRFHGGLAPIAAATRAIAEASGATLALHLDHAVSERLALEAIDLGFGSVMLDGAHLPFDENVAVTARVTAAAHAAGAAAEAELGEIGGKGAHAPGVRTDPDEARQFVEATGIDALAVAVGSEHAMLDRTASLDLDLIGALALAARVPLVLHGSSGVPDAAIQDAVRAGIRKVNVSTQLNKVSTAAIRAALDADPSLVDSRRFLGAGRDALAVEAERLLRLIALEG